MPISLFEECFDLFKVCPHAYIFICVFSCTHVRVRLRLLVRHFFIRTHNALYAEAGCAASQDLYYPIVKGWHKFDPYTQTHKSDLDPVNVKFTRDQQVMKMTALDACKKICFLQLFAREIISCRLSARTMHFLYS